MTREHTGGSVMNSRPWLASDDARLRELYPYTRTSALPELLGRSRMAIKVRASMIKTAPSLFNLLAGDEESAA